MVCCCSIKLKFLRVHMSFFAGWASISFIGYDSVKALGSYSLPCSMNYAYPSSTELQISYVSADLEKYNPIQSPQMNPMASFSVGSVLSNLALQGRNIIVYPSGADRSYTLEEILGMVGGLGDAVQNSVNIIKSL